MMTIGTVKFFNTTKGFGFIVPEGGGKDVFVHTSAVEVAGMPVLAKGQRLLYETEQNALGAAQACKLKPVPENVSSVSSTGYSPVSSTERRTSQRTTIREPSPKQPSSAPAAPRVAEPSTSRHQTKSAKSADEWQRSYDRYCDLARHANDDVVERERYWQHAEHFLRMINGSAD
jgi:cold shock protein